MSTVTIISPSAGLVASVAGLLQPDANDYSRNLVVFPGRRPAHFLRKEIAERQKGPFLPPEILSFEDLVLRLADTREGRPVRMIDTLDAVGILFGLHMKQSVRLGGDAFTTLERFFPLGEKLFNELEEMKMALLSARQVVEETGVVGYANLHVIAELYESFYRTIDRDGMATRAHAYARAADVFTADDLAAYDRVILAGLYALTPSEQVLIRAIGACPQSRLVFVQGPGLGDRLKALDMEAEDRGEATHEPVFEFVRSPDLHGQIAALAEKMRAEKARGAVPDEKNVLMLPRPDALFPVVNHLLPLFDDDAYNVSIGYPLTRTPLAGLFHSLFEAMERREGDRWFVPDYLRVMLHPYVKGVRWNGRTDVTRILVHSVEDWLGDAPGRSMRTLEEIEQSDELFTTAVLRVADESVDAGRLREHLRSLHDVLFRPWKDDATLSNFANACGQIVRFVHDRTNATRHPYFRAFSETMLDGLLLIGGSLLGSTTMGSVRSSFTLLQHVLRTRSVPFPGSPLHGFQVLGLLETRGLAFDNVYVLEANDDVLPGSSGPDRLLPESVRTKLGMETRQERERIIAYYLSVLFAGARKVWIAWDDSDGKEKSRYIEQLMWREEQTERRIRDRSSVPLIRYGLSLEAGRPTDVPKTELESAAIARRSLSPSSLDTYLKCQVRFYYGHVLGLSSPDDLTGEVDQADIGNLVHAVLQRGLSGLRERDMTPDDLDSDTIRQLAENVFDETFGVPTSASGLLMRERISEQLGRFVTEYQRPLAERTNVRVLSLEETLEGMVGGAGFRARTDRVEERTGPDGVRRFHILDYKTGGDPGRYAVDVDALDPDDPATWRDSIGSFQLFLYTLLYARARKIEPADVRAAYLFLGSQEVGPSIEVGLFGDEEGEKGADLERLEQVVRKLVEEMRDPDVPFRATLDPEQDCPACPFTTLCGTTWVKRRGTW